MDRLSFNSYEEHLTRPYYDDILWSGHFKRPQETEWAEQMKRFVGGRLWNMSKKRKKKEREMGQSGQSSKT